MIRIIDCPVCLHIERSLINNALAEGRPDSFVTEHFAIPPDAIRRHQAFCLGQDGSATASGESREVTPEASLAALRESALHIAHAAVENEKNWRTALTAISAASRLIVLETKLHDRKRPSAPRLADSAEWQELKTRILSALDRYPEARAALVEALQDDQA